MKDNTPMKTHLDALVVIRNSKAQLKVSNTKEDVSQMLSERKIYLALVHSWAKLKKNSGEIVDLNHFPEFK